MKRPAFFLVLAVILSACGKAEPPGHGYSLPHYLSSYDVGAELKFMGPGHLDSLFPSFHIVGRRFSVDDNDTTRYHALSAEYGDLSFHRKVVYEERDNTATANHWTSVSLQSEDFDASEPTVNFVGFSPAPYIESGYTKGYGWQNFENDFGYGFLTRWTGLSKDWPLPFVGKIRAPMDTHVIFVEIVLHVSVK